MLLTRSVRCKLLVSPDQTAALTALQPRITAAYNEAARHAFEHPEIKSYIQLHHALYTKLRADHGLKSQFVCNVQRDAFGSVATLRKRMAKGKKASAPHSFARAIPYDANSMTLRPDRQSVTLATDGKRIECGVVGHKHLTRYADWTTDSGKLSHDHHGWWLTFHFTKEVDEPKPTSSVLGCDRGIVIPAVLSNGVFLGDPAWHQVDRRYRRTQASLQAKGTTSAKRRLQQRAGKWSRFRAWCDHHVTSQILAACPRGTTLALEDLTDIRVRGRRFRKDTRRRLHAWSFHRQQEMLTYKAAGLGVTVVFVDARYTSQRCSACGHTSRKNRPSRERFVCQRCPHTEHADLNAARNIAANWTTSQPNGGPPVEVSPPHAAHAQDVRSPKPGRGMRTSGAAKGRSQGRSPKPPPSGEGRLLSPGWRWPTLEAMTPAASVLTSGATGGVLATVVRSTFEIAVAVGLDRASLLARIGVNEATLADPNAWVPIEAHTRLWEALGELPSAGTLSLVLAQSLQLDMLGVVGWAMMNAPVAGDLIRIGTRYASLFGDPYTPQIEDTDEAMIVRRVFEPRLVRTRVLPEYAPAASVQMFRDLAAIQPGEPLALAMWFQHEAPGDVAAHERFFGCPVRWSAPETRLVVAREAAERPIVQRNPELYAYLDRHALALAGTTAASASLSERVRAIIAGAIQGGEPAPAAVAKQLGMSERTLQRRLRDESRTFADILDAVRRELSVRYLSDPKLAVFEIAFLLGYAETSSFHRAFKRWTGEGPQEFRARPAAR